MKVSLINTPLDLKQLKGLRTAVLHTLFYNSAPLGLASLGAVLLEAGHQPYLIDALVEQLNFQGVIRRLAAQHPDLVGISATSIGYHGAVLMAAAIKQWRPRLPVLIGGPHVSANPEDTLHERVFDFGFIGEGEQSLLEFIDTYDRGGDAGTVDGLVWRRNGTILKNHPRRPIANLDSLPMPARHLLPIHRYRPVPVDARELPKLTLMSSRGCPFGCIFCDKSVFGRTYRMFSARRVVDEMEALVHDYGARDFAFLDSLFNLSIERVHDILDEMERRRLGVGWSCSVRVDALDRPLLERMKRNGCWRVRIGIESGHPEVLASIRKGITLDQVRRVTAWADELDMQPKAFFIIGHFTDTPDTIRSSIRFACSIPLKDITVQINTTLRNTIQWEEYARHGRIIEDRADQYSFWQPMFVPSGMTAPQLTRLHSRFYRAFYLRPSLIRRHLRAMRSWRDILVYLNAIRLPLSLFFHRA
ncbi:cobalamin-dependent protein [bacterium]|nr:cobalamin-dependent protein [candidate division CSSED10-310 bacterium]